MSSPKEFIQSLYEAFARGDAGFVLASFASNIQWMEAEGGPLEDRNPYTTPAVVGEGVFGRLMMAFDQYSAVPHTLIAQGDDVVALGRYGGTHRESGAELNAQFAHHWTVEGGKVTRFQQYTDTAQFTRLLG